MPRITREHSRSVPDGYQRTEVGKSIDHLKVAALELNQLAQGMCRYYRLDENFVANVSVSVHSIEWRVPGHPGEEPLNVRLEILDGYAHHGLGSLSMPALKRFVEIKAMFDQWMSGELAEMPPSTEPNYPVDLERRRQSGEL